MGPYFLPAGSIDGKSKYPCAWYAPGASGGVNIDGGAAVDPETGMLYVASLSAMSTTEIGKDPCSELDYTQAGASGPHVSCNLGGALPPPAGYTPPARGAGGRGAVEAAAAAAVAARLRRVRPSRARRASPASRSSSRRSSADHRVRHEQRRQEMVDVERRRGSADGAGGIA
jgi:hypothetical protein